MNPAQLLTHFDRIREAHDAIPRLRCFILDLAVRGKLVEQDQRDEPAPELLKRIQAEKARLVKEGKIGPEKPPIHASADELAFELKPGWQAARISQIIVELQTGPFGSSLHQSDYQKGGIPVINPASIKNERLIPVESMAVGPKTLERLATFKLRTGDIVMARRGEMGRCAVVTEQEDGWLCGTGSLILRLPECVFPRFLVTLIGSPFVREYLDGSAVGATMQNLNQSILLSLVIGLPPLAEQHRIVAKVDELMALCDRLEAAQTERESRRDRLVASSLNRLDNGADAETFREHARFYFNHLPCLTTRKEHIQQLRQTILNLALRGKLVLQDPNDEPVSELLKRIQAEQEDLIKARVLKPNERDSRLLEEDLPCDLPPTWQWAPLRSIIVFGPQNGISPKPSSLPYAPRAITLTATTSGKFNPQHFKQVEASILPDSEFWLRSGDLLFQRGNTREYVGMAAYYTGEPRLFLYPDLMMKVRLSEKVSLRYVHLGAVAPSARAYFATHATGAQSTMPKINQRTLLQLQLPIPPLAEQQRIVAKVEELMALCDRLEAQLTTTQTESRHLLEAVLHEALSLKSKSEQMVVM
ncbi:MAG: restriction endonuclease subunit S [Nitrospira defluvii]|nr:restriction endonuclease subunit S [Nitrospira defluvii]